MAVPFAAVLAALLMTTPSPIVAMHPGAAVAVIVTDANGRALPGVEVRLCEATSQPQSNAPRELVRFLTDSDGRARFSLPREGSYTLGLRMSGFLPTILGPFVVCPAGQSSCGPSLVTPVRVTLPPAAFVDGAVVR